MVKKIKKYAKFIVCVALIMGLIAPSYAALSASDGSAFVTKAEFDSALADFNARLTTFEAGINSKIDSQVTTYLDRNGIWSGKSVSCTYVLPGTAAQQPFNSALEINSPSIRTFGYSKDGNFPGTGFWCIFPFFVVQANKAGLMRANADWNASPGAIMEVPFMFVNQYADSNSVCKIWSFAIHWGIIECDSYDGAQLKNRLYNDSDVNILYNEDLARTNAVFATVSPSSFGTQTKTTTISNCTCPYTMWFFPVTRRSNECYVFVEKNHYYAMCMYVDWSAWVHPTQSKYNNLAGYFTIGNASGSMPKQAGIEVASQQTVHGCGGSPIPNAELVENDWIVY